MLFWHSEACDLRPDPVSGAAICRLTYAARHSTNLYFEQPYGTPDGRRFAFGRCWHVDPRLPPTELCVADIPSYKVASIDDDIVSSWFATSPWSGKIHYLRGNGELVRVDLDTLEREIALSPWPLPSECTLWSVSPDMRYLITALRRPDYHTEIVRVDLKTGDCQAVYRQRNVLGHMQLDPTDGRSLLVQVNRGMAMNHLREVERVDTEHPGATHIVVDIFEGTDRPLRVGEPFTLPSTGHATWVGTSGRMATPVQWPGMRTDFAPETERPGHDPRHSQGNLVVVGPEDEKPTVFPAPNHLFDHASVSRCGTYFVADCVCHGIPGPVEIVAGNLRTGKSRVLVSNTGATMGGPACSHVHPYLTADNRRVIYNADPDGLGQVHAATVPEGFWDSLG